MTKRKQPVVLIECPLDDEEQKTSLQVIANTRLRIASFTSGLLDTKKELVKKAYRRAK